MFFFDHCVLISVTIDFRMELSFASNSSDLVSCCAVRHLFPSDILTETTAENSAELASAVWNARLVLGFRGYPRLQPSYP